jgi:hypothetical protein
LNELGYRRKEGASNSWYAPRGTQVDFYTRDLGKISVDWIRKTAIPVRIGKKEIRVISLEGLIIAKHRAGRTQDVANLKELMTKHSRNIRWDVMGEVGTDLEIAELRRVARALGT